MLWNFLELKVFHFGSGWFMVTIYTSHYYIYNPSMITTLHMSILYNILVLNLFHSVSKNETEKVPFCWPNGKSKILCSQNFRSKNGFVTIMVVGHFLGGFEPQNFFLDIFFCPFFKISRQNAKKCPTSINAIPGHLNGPIKP